MRTISLADQDHHDQARDTAGVFRKVCRALGLMCFHATAFISTSSVCGQDTTQHTLRRWNPYLRDQVHDHFFRIASDPNDTLSSALDTAYTRAVRKYSTLPPLEMKDCAHFKPYESYIGHNTGDPKSEYLTRSFILNKTYGSTREYVRVAMLPGSIRLNLDSANVEVIPGQLHLLVSSDFKVRVDDYLRPFHFRKYEVTNHEYRQFTEWVRDSLARRRLFDAGFGAFGNRTTSGEVRLNWNTPIEWFKPEYQKALKPLFFSESERFYRQQEVDPRKLNYSFFLKEEPDKAIVLNIYPDTISWVHDFTFSFNEPMVENYFWHPKYDDHPVVGVSYWQALAYLDWRTKLHQLALDRRGVRLKVEYDLPSEIQWDMAATAEMENGKPRPFGQNYEHLSDANWITDLRLTFEAVEHTDSTTAKTVYMTVRRDRLFDVLNHQFKFDGVLVIDRSFHTTKSNIDLIDKKERSPMLTMQVDPSGICYMGGNVSEWLKDPYTQWKSMFELRQQQLATFEDEDTRILSAIERYWDRRNDADGRLVRGSNWWDERFSSRLGMNSAGMHAKVFVSPNKAHCTLGFRYVVFVEPAVD